MVIFLLYGIILAIFHEFVMVMVFSPVWDIEALGLYSVQSIQVSIKAPQGLYSILETGCSHQLLG